MQISPFLPAPPCSMFQLFHQEIKTQFGHNVKILRTDTWNICDMISLLIVLLMGYFIKLHVPIPLNKTVLLNARIVIFLTSLALLCLRCVFLVTYGVMQFLLPRTWSIGFRHPFLVILSLTHVFIPPNPYSLLHPGPMVFQFSLSFHIRRPSPSTFGGTWFDTPFHIWLDFETKIVAVSAISTTHSSTHLTQCALGPNTFPRMCFFTYWNAHL